ncbi:hypothetical protein GYO_4144 [Bacillus spizizenii TU-B-10]|uniref:Uncharacterized protein n=1 Tax=Bacillus spizizenii (strain DSM 15029 / JCM 12233 / NBRC 101239 / NRRL B-23049 / TU-B-10) TaxID=1052585 RepID=G4NXK9_BACS4|nr:hypothetical protein GYO_4144 [Bacillus spizizenii TU-B-10]
MLTIPSKRNEPFLLLFLQNRLRSQKMYCKIYEIINNQ